MPRHDVCVILPCAGEGSRLGLPFPKELAPLNRGRLLIDSCLDLIRSAEIGSKVRILLLENGQREQTAAYIRRQLPDIPLAMVRQPSSAQDMPDAIMALRPWLSHANVLLLPDCIYEYEGDPVTEVAEKASSFSFAFGAVQGPPEMIRHLGALRTEDNRVLAYEDKPGKPGEYDAAWAMLGFGSGGWSMECLQHIQLSTLKKVRGAITVSPLVNAPVVWLKDFRDCGTWASYEAERR